MTETGLKRIHVVKFLEETFNNKNIPKAERISPTKDDYKTKYVKYVCFKLGLEEKDLPDTIYYDIYMIKTYFSKCQYSVDRMISKHQQFFDSPAAHIKGAPVVPPPKHVCSFF